MGQKRNNIDWPPRLTKLREAAIQVLKGANAIPSSPADRGEHKDLVTVLRAMADPRKKPAVYVAMARAAGTVVGRPPSVIELQEGAELSRGLGQTSLTDDERQAVGAPCPERAVERVARST